MSRPHLELVELLGRALISKIHIESDVKNRSFIERLHSMQKAYPITNRTCGHIPYIKGLSKLKVF